MDICASLGSVTESSMTVTLWSHYDVPHCHADGYQASSQKRINQCSSIPTDLTALILPDPSLSCAILPTDQVRVGYCMCVGQQTVQYCTASA